MPLFHSNALMAGWGPALMAGSAFALPAAGRFSASGFLPDVRAAGATYFNYVGKPLSYILATPEQPDDADNPLVRAFGNEGTDRRRGPLRRALRRRRHRLLRLDRGRRHRAADAGHAAGRARAGARGHRRARPGHRRGVPAGALRRAAAGCSTPRRPSASWCPRPAAPASRATGATARPRRPGCARAGTGPATWPTATRRASSTSPAGTTTGSASTARTSPRPRSSGSCSATPTSCWPSVYAVPDPVVGDQVMAAVQLRPGSTRSTRPGSPPSWPRRATSAPSGRRASCA